MQKHIQTNRKIFINILDIQYATGVIWHISYIQFVIYTTMHRGADLSLDHAILGFLSKKPLSGYDLKAEFDASVKHFWSAEQSQIYRTLTRLAENGFAEIEIVRQEDKPDKKVYHITDSGRKELHNWLIADQIPSGAHISSLVKIFFASELDDSEILELLHKLAGHLRCVLEKYKKTYKSPCCNNQCKDKRSAFFKWMTLDYGICATKTSLEWIENLIKKVEIGEYTN